MSIHSKTKKSCGLSFALIALGCVRIDVTNEPPSHKAMQNAIAYSNVSDPSTICSRGQRGIECSLVGGPNLHPGKSERRYILPGTTNTVRVFRGGAICTSSAKGMNCISPAARFHHVEKIDFIQINFIT